LPHGLQNCHRSCCRSRRRSCCQSHCQRRWGLLAPLFCPGRRRSTLVANEGAGPGLFEWRTVCFFPFNLQSNFVSRFSPSTVIQIWWYLFLNFSKINIYLSKLSTRTTIEKLNLNHLVITSNTINIFVSNNFFPNYPIVSVTYNVIWQKLSLILYLFLMYILKGYLANTTNKLDVHVSICGSDFSGLESLFHSLIIKQSILKCFFANTTIYILFSCIYRIIKRKLTSFNKHLFYALL
jgi:hypothetical protein